MRARRVYVLAVAAVLVLGAAACGSSSKNGSSSDATTTTAGAAASKNQTDVVKVDYKTTAYNFGATGYFPTELKVHPGDTLDFPAMFTGEPHTVTLGTLVDQGVPKAIAAGPNATSEPPELQKLPALLPQGPGDANQMAANPCFLASGDPPQNKACPKVEQPKFDGTQSVYNSGFIADGDTFKMTLADDIKPGTYYFFCLLHREGMIGKFTVVPAATAVPTPEQVAAAGDKAGNDLVAKLKPAHEAMLKGTLPPLITTAAPNAVVAGGANPDVQEALVLEFGPKNVKIPVGGSVTWHIVGPHTVSFNASEDVASSILIKGPDGAFHANQTAAAPAGGWPGQPQPPANAPAPDPNAPPGPPKLVDAGSWDGTGFHSSGVFVSFPPDLFDYKVTFTKAGTYPYKCLVHPNMEGTITVG